MAFRTKRTFSQSHSPPSQTSSEDELDPPLKRRVLSPPSSIPDATSFGRTDDGDQRPIYAPYYTPFPSLGAGSKRRADEVDLDDEDDDGFSSEGGDASSSSTATYDGYGQPLPNAASHSSQAPNRPPPVKRLRRGLSSHLRRMGLNPDDPSIEEQPEFQRSAHMPPWASSNHPANPSFAHVEPSSVVEPGEVGPAVWLGHAPVRDEVRFEELTGDGGREMEEARTKAWELEVWKGARSGASPESKERGEVRLPSYMSSSSPWAYNLEPPPDVYTNRERGLVLYNRPPARPSIPSSSQLSEQSNMDLDTSPTPPPASGPYTSENEYGGLNAGGWFIDESRFEEIPEEPPVGADAEGGMDVD